MSVDVVGLGTCNADFILKVPRFVCGDDEVDVQQIFTSLGGSATNFTVGISRLDVKSGIIARVGDDELGTWALNNFQGEGVDVERLLLLEGSTGMTFIAVDPSGERSIYSFMGANKDLKLNKDDLKYIKNSKLLHISGTYREVADEASKHANTLSFNPGTLLAYYGLENLSQIIKRAKFLFLNEKELYLLTKKDLELGTQAILDLDVPYVIVTRGAEGANLYTPEEVIHYPAYQVKTADTTGAGDAFAAGFIASYIKKKDVTECMDYANYVASECVKKFGPMNVPKIH
ncbi:MAG: carbohydrate kinase family protein [Methanomicrobiales archaeon]